MLAAIGELLVAAGIPTVPETAEASLRRTAAGAAHLIEHWAELPAVIVICAANVYPPANPQQFMALSSIYAAAQNMVVAARALGLGAAFTTFQYRCEPEVRALLGIPPEQIIGVMMPIGYPARAPKAVRRKPLDEVLHYDHW
jgi:nitroreductase